MSSSQQSQQSQQTTGSSSSTTSKSEIAREIPKLTQELATQAAQRAQEMLKSHHVASSSLSDTSLVNNKKVPEIPSRSSDKPPPEIPPKRHSLKKIVSDGGSSNSGLINRPPPPLPQKPQSVQNSPQFMSKFKDKSQSGLPQIPVRPAGTPQIMHKIQDKSGASGSAQPVAKFNEKITNSPQFGVRNINSPQLSFHSTPSTATNSPQLQSKKVTSKTISPSEDFGSEDALRGIESGLRNMERAMQEQMNLRSLEAAAANQPTSEGFNFSVEFKSGNMRSMGSITSLDGSTQNMRALENMRLGLDGQNFNPTMRGLERNLSMDQMRLDSFHSSVRSMESNPNIRTTLDEMKIRGGGGGGSRGGDGGSQKDHNIRASSVEHHMRSLDRNLPLELQYSRHRSQDFSGMVSGDFREHIRHQLVGGGCGAGGMPISSGVYPGMGGGSCNAGAAASLMQQPSIQTRQTSAGLSREDLRMRRRSSHDETQLSQGIPGNDVHSFIYI